MIQMIGFNRCQDAAVDSESANRARELNRGALQQTPASEGKNNT